MARRMRQTGKVEVEVIVDENGKVVSAHAIAGPSVLRDVAVDAARRARFYPDETFGTAGKNFRQDRLQLHASLQDPSPNETRK